jgi:hypothetical protein
MLQFLLLQPRGTQPFRVLLLDSAVMANENREVMGLRGHWGQGKRGGFGKY